MGGWVVRVRGKLPYGPYPMDPTLWTLPYGPYPMDHIDSWERERERSDLSLERAYE